MKYYAFVYGRCFKARTVTGVHALVARFEDDNLDRRLMSYVVKDL